MAPLRYHLVAIRVCVEFHYSRSLGIRPSLQGNQVHEGEERVRDGGGGGGLRNEPRIAV